MEERSEKHLQGALRKFISDASKKYRDGNKEHKGNLLDLSINDLLSETGNENIDQFFYIDALKEKVKRLEAVVDNEYFQMQGEFRLKHGDKAEEDCIKILARIRDEINKICGFSTQS